MEEHRPSWPAWNAGAECWDASTRSPNYGKPSGFGPPRTQAQQGLWKPARSDGSPVSGIGSDGRPAAGMGRMWRPARNMGSVQTGRRNMEPVQRGPRNMDPVHGRSTDIRSISRTVGRIRPEHPAGNPATARVQNPARSAQELWKRSPAPAEYGTASQPGPEYGTRSNGPPKYGNRSTRPPESANRSPALDACGRRSAVGSRHARQEDRR